MAHEALTDEELARLGGEGDDGAFTALYQRYFHRTYDFALRLTRNAEDAADVTQSTFLKVYQGLARRKSAASFKSWLFTIAHNDAMDLLRRSKRTTPGVDVYDERLAVVDASRLSDPLDEAVQSELAGAVWQAASSLSPSDYALLDMHVRQGLDAGEIATAIGARRETVHTQLSRLRESFGHAFRTLALLATGKSRCEQLARIAPAGFSQDTRRLVEEHVKGCDICQESERRVASIVAEDWLGSLALVPAATGLYESVLAQVLATGGSGGENGGRDDAPASGGGFPGWLVAWWRGLGSGRRVLVVALTGLLLIVIALGGIAIAGAFGDGDGNGAVAVTATATTTPGPTATNTALPTTTPTPTLPPTTTPTPAAPQPTETSAPPPEDPTPTQPIPMH